MMENFGEIDIPEDRQRLYEVIIGYTTASGMLGKLVVTNGSDATGGRDVLAALVEQVGEGFAVHPLALLPQSVEEMDAWVEDDDLITDDELASFLNELGGTDG